VDLAQPAEAARALLRAARKGALATVAPGTRAPYASLVLVAADAGDQPLFLLSALALHTQNLAADPRASLLVDGSDATGDPMAGARASFMGEIHRLDEPAARAAFLVYHPSAAAYAGFGDFALYRMQVDAVHVIQGFGRIVTIPGVGWQSG
jgi:heme iron utilization protein